MCDIIDDSDGVPSLKNRRVNIFDVMMTVRISPDPVKDLSDVWDLSQKEANCVIQYIEENKSELEEKEEKLRNDTTNNTNNQIIEI